MQLFEEQILFSDMNEINNRELILINIRKDFLLILFPQTYYLNIISLNIRRFPLFIGKLIIF
jgi:hypothetical protein